MEREKYVNIVIVYISLSQAVKYRKKLKKNRSFSFLKKKGKSPGKEYAQIYGIVMELLDRMVEILGEEEITRTEFVQLLKLVFAKSKVALIPPSMDQGACWRYGKNPSERKK